MSDRIWLDLKKSMDEAKSETRVPAPIGSPDPVNSPDHYTAHPSGVECIEIVEHMNFNLGNAVKYIWRCDLKGNAIEDLQKARKCIEREIKRRGGE